MMKFSGRCVSALTLSLLLFGCGGGSGGSQGGGLAGLFGQAGSSGSQGASGAGQVGDGRGDGQGDAGGTDEGNVPVAATTALVSRLGKPARVLVGLGTTSIDEMKTQGIRPDIVDTYLVGVGPKAWPTWNSPEGAYITFRAKDVRAYGAIPMFTLYQVTASGAGGLDLIDDATFMSGYWAQVRLMYQRIADVDGPVLVNLEPDFWGFLAARAPDRDATKMPAVVNDQPECADLPNTAAGLGQCLVQMGRQIAPKALVGFPPAFWSGTAAEIGAQMQAVGADKADFIVAQTSDRDAGCWEADPAPDECKGRSGPFYWDETNFHQSQSQISAYRTALGNGLPILWWQTPMGVPSDTPGGTDRRYRDNHVDYMLRNTQEYGDIHTFAIVFSAGGSHQTSITTDGGQFARLSGEYLARGGAALK